MERMDKITIYKELSILVLQVLWSHLLSSLCLVPSFSLHHILPLASWHISHWQAVWSYDYLELMHNSTVFNIKVIQSCWFHYPHERHYSCVYSTPNPQVCILKLPHLQVTSVGSMLFTLMCKGRVEAQRFSRRREASGSTVDHHHGEAQLNFLPRPWWWLCLACNQRQREDLNKQGCSHQTSLRIPLLEDWCTLFLWFPLRRASLKGL